jgi:hypothetical protein
MTVSGSARAGRAGLRGPGTGAVQGNSQRQLKRTQRPGRPRSRRLAAGRRRLVVEIGERGGFFKLALRALAARGRCARGRAVEMSGGVGEGGEGEGSPRGGSLMFSAAAAAAVLGDCLVPRSGTAACCRVAASLLFRSKNYYNIVSKKKRRKQNVYSTPNSTYRFLLTRTLGIQIYEV